MEFTLAATYTKSDTHLNCGPDQSGHRRGRVSGRLRRELSVGDELRVPHLFNPQPS